MPLTRGAPLREPSTGTFPGVEVAERVQGRGASLTAAERRVAQVLLARPQLVGFGTVADLAAEAGTGAATVVRLAAKLGYSGFSALQDAVQSDLSHQLRPAAERILEGGSDHPLQLARVTETGNVMATLDAVDADELAAVGDALSDLGRHVLVLAGDAASGVARQFADELFSLRPDVRHLDGNEVSLHRDLALAGASPVVVAIDVRRYDRWLFDAARAVTAKGATLVALTDSVLSPFARDARHTFVLSAASVGPFDSQVGTLALLNTIVAAVADRLRSSASVRLDQAEQAWTESGSLTDG